MPKANGLVTWKSFALFITLGGVVLIGCWGYSVSAKTHAQENELRMVKVEATQGGMQGDIQDIKAEQMRQSAKLDRILERLP